MVFAMRRRVRSSKVSPPMIGQNCLGRSSPAIVLRQRQETFAVTSRQNHGPALTGSF